MRHIFTALVSAIEAAVISLAGLVLIAIPVLLTGIITFSLSVEASTLGTIISALWLLGHGATLRLRLSEESLLELGLETQPMLVEFSLIPLGLSLISVLLAWNMGRRFSEEFSTGLAAVIGGTLGFAVVTWILSTATHEVVAEPAWQLSVYGLFWFGIPSFLGLGMQHADVLGQAWFRVKVTAEHYGAPKLGWSFETYVGRTLKLVGALLAAIMALGGFTVTVALIFGYVDVMSLTQSMQLDAIGDIVFFVGQLVFLPTFMLWAIAWLSGAGFQIGAGSMVSPFETLLGPLPSVPVFAAIPDAWGNWGFAAILLIVLAAAVVGVCFGDLPEFRNPPAWVTAIVAVVGAVLAATCFGLMLMLSSGAMGPGRLTEVGPDAWLSALLLAGELAVGLVAGMMLRRAMRTSLLKAGDKEPELVEIVSAPPRISVPARAQPGEATHSLASTAVETEIDLEEAETVDLTFAVGEAHLQDERCTSTQATEVAEHPDPSETQETVDLSETVLEGEESDPFNTHEEPVETTFSRIADPEEDTDQPWFRKAVKPKKKRELPSFDPERLEEAYSWDAPPVNPEGDDLRS